MDPYNETEQIEYYAELKLAELLADEGSVEEAIGQNADLVRVALAELKAHPESAKEIARRLESMISSYLEPTARRAAYRELMVTI
jgi:hypothetical protein